MDGWERKEMFWGGLCFGGGILMDNQYSTAVVEQSIYYQDSSALYHLRIPSELTAESAIKF